MIQIDQLRLRQGNFSLDGVELTIPAGHYGVLMGPSGCGKTTLLEVVCGLRPIFGGTIYLDSRDVTTLKPGERSVGYVPQDRALFPTMIVREQLAFALVIRKVPNRRISARVAELADLLGIEHILDRTPDSLSGGESQRVALGRALAFGPPVLCLDEPLNALDEAAHDGLCDLLGDIHRRTGVTVLHVTHSRREAELLGDLIYRFEGGMIRKVERT